MLCAFVRTYRFCARTFVLRCIKAMKEQYDLKNMAVTLGDQFPLLQSLYLFWLSSIPNR